MIEAGVMLTPVVPVSRMAELALLAEQLGYGRVWVPDEGLASRDVFVAMTAIAQATQTIRIGTGIVNPYSRNPALIASAVATIDELSNGRAFLGYGAGGSLTLGPLGIERPHPLAHVRDALEASRRLLAGEVVDMNTETLTLHGASLSHHRRDLEIWFAGRGPRMLRQAGAMADGVLLEFLHKETLGDYVDSVRQGANGRADLPRICYATTVITNPDRMDEVRPHMAYRLVDSPPSVKEMLGMSESDVKAISEAMHTGLGAAAELIPDEWVDPFVIRGSASECSAELEQLVTTHRFDEFMLVVADMTDADVLMAEVAEVFVGTTRKGDDDGRH